MSSPIRILIADDSAVVRRLLTEVLSAETDMEVIGAAKNGQLAVVQCADLKPDVVLLDVEMPVMDGLTALRQLRQSDRWLPVIMFSSLTVSGAKATLEALSCGASDYVPKPSGTGHILRAVQYVKDELVPRVRHWGQRIRTVKESPIRIRKDSPIVTVPSSAKRPPTAVVAIGSSTGGPNALADILSQLPPGLGVPILVAQHMPAVFTQMLAQRLDRRCHLSVREATDGCVVSPGNILIAPGDQHMEVVSNAGAAKISLNHNPPENSCRPSVDVLFRSVAKTYGERALAIVLTGMGKDGLEGCRILQQVGAHVVVQDEDSSVVWGMPRAVAEAGLANRVRPLGDIATEITMSAGCSSHSDRCTTGVAGR